MGKHFGPCPQIQAAALPRRTRTNAADVRQECRVTLAAVRTFCGLSTLILARPPAP